MRRSIAWRRIVGSVAVTALLLAASIASGQTPGWTTALPACAQWLAAPASSWLVVDLIEDGVTFRVPPGTIRKRSPMGTCLHGCEDWTNGGLTVRATNGSWGEGSFSESLRRNACALRKQGTTLIVMKSPSERSAVVWTLRGGRPTKNMTSILEVRWTASTAEWADAVIGSIEPGELPPAR